MSAQKNVEWLRLRTEQYRATTNDICEVIDDFEGVEKLGQGFSSADLVTPCVSNPHDYVNHMFKRP
jgi:hypothetical protein